MDGEKRISAINPEVEALRALQANAEEVTERVRRSITAERLITGVFYLDESATFVIMLQVGESDVTFGMDITQLASLMGAMEYGMRELARLEQSHAAIDTPEGGES